MCAPGTKQIDEEEFNHEGIDFVDKDKILMHTNDFVQAPGIYIKNGEVLRALGRPRGCSVHRHFRH